MDATRILMGILIGIGGLALITLFAQLFKLKIWIYEKGRRSKRMTRIGFLKETTEDEVPEVHLPDMAKAPAIGRIRMGDKDDNAYVEVLLTDPEDESEKPRYHTYGYISQEGWIYRINEKTKKTEKIGYTARPSKPDEPTSIGERTWRTLWLRCTLNAYLGIPSETISDKDSDSSSDSSSKRDKNIKKGKAQMKRPDAYATYVGIHSSSKDPIPPEARGAAYGIFFSQYNKRNYQEHYSAPSYGWKDTALPAAFIYSVLYIIWYIFNVKIRGLMFIGYRFWQDIPLYFSFFAIWVIVRAIKIECIERSDTIQPKIDLFNRVLGQRWFDISVLICCAFTLGFSPKYYRFDFIPLAAVIITAIAINFTLKVNTKPWKTINPFSTDDSEDDFEELENPRGDIERHYEWELDSPETKDVKGSLSLFFNAQYISDLRTMNPFFSQRKDKPVTVLVKEMFTYLKSHKSISARSRFIVKRIEEISRQKGLSDEDTLQFMLDFVQEPNIRFVLNRDSDAILKFEDYIRYPDEVLYDKEADSNSKAFLAAVLVHYLKHNVIFMYSRMQQHGAIGIEIDPAWERNGSLFGRTLEEIVFTHDGRNYVFCETTADGFRIGGTMGGMRPEDFDERVELPLIDGENEESNEETDTRLYNWDLDSEKGNSLHGSYTIEFNSDEIEALRKENPFVRYGEDGKTYEDNVRSMFEYLNRVPERRKNVKELASYIKKRVSEQGLDSLDLVQFALDFCQAPNITYKIDEECVDIPYNQTSKEYMRFPDEVLFDKEGDCDCKSSLTMALFKELGYKVIFMMSQKYGHAAVGVEYKPEWKEIIGIIDEDEVIIEHNGIRYLYCETTGDGYRVGHINKGNTIQEFETLVEV